jgi:CelD/BcsL family acetyltransferase involved in cellulose biosynthesis
MSALPVPSMPDRMLGLTVETITDEGTFQGLERAWNRLVEGTGIEHPFLRHQWVSAWWAAFGRGRQLHVVLIHDGAELIALAPLMLSKGRMYGLPVRRLEFLANDHVPRFDVLVLRRHEEVYRALWEHLSGLTGAWDVLQLTDIPKGSRTLEELPRLARADGFPTGAWPSLVSPYVPVRGSWDAYQGGLRSKHRSNLRNRLRRLERLGPVSLEVVEGGDGVPAALEDALRLEAAAWKGDAGTAILCLPEVEAFYRGLAARAAQEGWLRLYFLRAGDARIAFEFDLVLGGNVYVLKLGYDPEYGAYSPQNLLCFMVLQEAFRAGIAEFDFTGPNEGWKAEWARESRPHEWLFVFRPRLRLRALRFVKFVLLPALRRRSLGAALRSAALRCVGESS